jgi:phosphatidylethanolamine-binding protein (PEBP) family uncharacterized protein
MRGTPRALTGAVLLMMLALAGCGSSTTTAKIPRTNISFTSPVLQGTNIPARYTCDGKDISPPFQWGPVPAGTRELVILVLRITPLGANGRYSVQPAWGLAGINPALHKIAAGEIPRGAHTGSTNEGHKRYEICPPRGETANFQFSLYSVPTSVSVPNGFGDLQVLTGLLSNNPTLASRSSGGFPATYKRR